MNNNKWINWGDFSRSWARQNYFGFIINKIKEEDMSEVEDLKKWLKECGDVSRDALRKMGMQTNLPDLEAVKTVASHAVGLHNSREFVPVGELYIKK
jgi:hypothetical protein